MGTMCSVVTGKGFVTFDIDVGPNGAPIYIVSCWNGREWQYSRYNNFKPAHATYKLVSRMI